MSEGGLVRVLLAATLFAVCTTEAPARQACGALPPGALPTPAPAPERAALPTPTSPPFKQLRYEEDWSSLRDPARRTNPTDRFKYILLRDREGWHLSLGGEVRARFERYGAPSWGQAPEDDDGHLLQRYMLHADFHLGGRLRLFAQIKSGLEDGRGGGPRPKRELRHLVGNL